MKLVEFNPNVNIAIVYHIEKHRCWQKIDENTRKAALNRDQGSRRLGSARQMAIDNLEHLISTGALDEAEEEASRWVNYRLAKRVIDTTHEERRDLNSFDAVGIIKQIKRILTIYIK